MKKKEFRADEFEKMFVNVNALKAGDLILSSTPLGEYSEFRAEMQEYGQYREEMLRYMCLVYDPQSPYVKHYDNIIDRKLDALIDVGVRPIKGGRLPMLIEEMVKCHNRTFNDMIIKYCRLCSGGERTYMALVAANEFYWGQMKRLFMVTPGNDDDALVDADKKAKLFKSMAEQEGIIESLEDKLLALDDNPQLRSDVWVLHEDKRNSHNRLSPEHFSKKAGNGKK